MKTITNEMILRTSFSVPLELRKACDVFFLVHFRAVKYVELMEAIEAQGLEYFVHRNYSGRKPRLLVARFTAPKMPSLKYSTEEEVSEASVLVSIRRYEDVNYAVIAPAFSFQSKGGISNSDVDLPTMLVDHFVSGQLWLAKL